MKTFWTTVFLAATLCGVALGQEGTAPPTATAPLNGPQIPATQSAPPNSVPNQCSADRSGKRDPRRADKKH